MYNDLQQERVHLNIRRLALVFLLSTGVPLILGVVIDIVSGTAPFATIIVGLISIPVASVVVSRAVLAEFDVMVDSIAPGEIATDVSSESVAESRESHEAIASHSDNGLI